MSLTDSFVPFALVVCAVFLGWLRAHLVRRELPENLLGEIERDLRQSNGDFSDD